jgi:hypothetical protein
LPSAWLIVGLISMAGIAWVIDSLVFKPRSKRYVVAGREVFIRRKSDQQLQYLLMAVGMLAVFAVGALIEGERFLLVAGCLGSVAFGMFSVLSISRQKEMEPTEKALKASDEFTRTSLGGLWVFVLAEVVGILAVEIHHPIVWVFIAVQPLLWVAGGWHAWRLWQAAATARRAAEGE